MDSRNFTSDMGEEYPSMSESAVWDALRQGEIGALEYLYRSYYTVLYTYGKRLSSSGELAEDTIQDLFFKIWQRRSFISPVKSIKAYLIKAYRRILIDKIKLLKRNIAPNDDETIELDVQDLLIQEETRHAQAVALENGIKHLTSKQREIIYLRFYKDLSYDEISCILEINNQTVRNAMCNSLKLLKKALLFLLMVA